MAFRTFITAEFVCDQCGEKITISDGNACLPLHWMQMKATFTHHAPRDFATAKEDAYFCSKVCFIKAMSAHYNRLSTTPVGFEHCSKINSDY